jgi:hypothetical protein
MWFLLLKAETSLDTESYCRAGSFLNVTVLGTGSVAEPWLLEAAQTPCCTEHLQNGKLGNIALCTARARSQNASAVSEVLAVDSVCANRSLYDVGAPFIMFRLSMTPHFCEAIPTRILKFLTWPTYSLPLMECACKCTELDLKAGDLF